MFSASVASSRSSSRVTGSITTFSSTVPKRLRGGVDLRLGLARQADHLGVAAAFEVEDRGVRPAMLVVADQRAARDRPTSVVLPVPERPKKIAVSPFGPMFAEQCIGMTPCARQQVVQDAEDRLLHLAGIGRAADQDQLLR